MRYFQVYFLFVILLVASTSMAQTATTDSLESRFNAAKPAQQLGIARQLMTEFRTQRNAEATLRWAHTGRQLAQQLDSATACVKFAAREGQQLVSLQQTDAALELLDSALAASQTSTPDALGTALVCKGYYHIMTGSLDEAEAIYRESYQWGRQRNDRDIVTNSLNNLSYLYNRMSQLDSALNVSAKLIDYFESINDQKELVKQYINYGSRLSRTGRLDSAMTALAKADTIAERLKRAGDPIDDRFRFHIYNNYATVLDRFGDPLTSLDYQYKARDIAEADPALTNEYFVISINIAFLLDRMGEAEPSLAVLRPLVRDTSFYGNQRYVIYTLEHLFAHFGDQGLRDSAATYLDIAETVPVLEEQAAEQAMLKGMRGDLLILDGQYTAGINQRQAALTLLRATGQTESEVTCLRKLAKAFLLAGQPDSAIAYANQALQLAEETGIIVGTDTGNEVLADAHAQKGNYKLAFEHLQIARNLDDSLSGESQRETVTFLRLQKEQADKLAIEQETELIKAQAAQQKAETDKANQRLYGALIGAAILLLAILLVWISRQRQAKLRREVAEQRDTISLRDAEKAVLLKEIHHRVKNNLQLVSSLLQLQSKTIDNEAALAAMHEGQNRMKAIALIHQKLYQTDDLAHINAQEYFDQLLSQNMALYAGGNRPGTNVSAGNIALDIDTAVPIGLIANELVTNAIKYAFPTTEYPKLELELAPKEQGIYTLTVTDNGPGLPADLDANSAKSLGLRMVNRLADQLFGEVEFASNNGTKVTVTFKDTEARKLED